MPKKSNLREFRNVMSTTPESAGGVTIKDLEEALANQLQLVRVAEEFAWPSQATSGDHKIAILRTPAAVAVKGENESVTATVPVFAEVDSEIVKHIVHTAISNELLEDWSGAAQQAWIANTANALLQSEEKVFWSGNAGPPTVTGILAGITATVTGPTDVGSITLQHLTDVVKNVPSIAGSLRWYMSNSVFADLSARLQAAVGFVSGEPALLGYPVSRSAGMPPASTPSGAIVAFGHLASAAAFVRRSGPSVNMLAEMSAIASSDQMALNVRSRCGPALLDGASGALTVLTLV